MSLLMVELNEVNFDQIKSYIALGRLPNFARFIENHGVSETTSETDYENLEPWIQWVSAHTGKTLSEHEIFRLGDIVHHDIDQIWEVLERQGIKVGAISPMNAKNRCSNPAFFLPDPWTPTRVSGPRSLVRLHDPIVQAVNDNAQSRISSKTALSLVTGLARFATPTRYPGYLSDAIFAASGRQWRKAMLLDRFLFDVFVRQVRTTKTDFATIFLNAAAHIQHHYLFNSKVYEGENANPSWYVDGKFDPVYEVYNLYDQIVGVLCSAFPGKRLMLATGLHQDPYTSTTLYWRLRDHAGYMSRLGIPHERVEPRMSRDFVVYCTSIDQACEAERRLLTAKSPDNVPIFSVDNRGDTLFVELIWPGDIDKNFFVHLGDRKFANFKDDVSFVAIKNGRHNGTGYFLDSGASPEANGTFPITDIPKRICAALGVEWTVI